VDSPYAGLRHNQLLADISTLLGQKQKAFCLKGQKACFRGATLLDPMCLEHIGHL
jgi:hypothetical protein